MGSGLGFVMNPTKIQVFKVGLDRSPRKLGSYRGCYMPSSKWELSRLGFNPVFKAGSRLGFNINPFKTQFLNRVWNRDGGSNPVQVGLGRVLLCSRIALRQPRLREWMRLHVSSALVRKKYYMYRMSLALFDKS